MIYEVFSNINMGADFESDWLPVSINSTFNDLNEKTLNSIQLSWDNVTGVGDGSVVVVGANNIDSPPYQQTYSFYQEPGSSSSTVFVIHPIFSFLKVKYIKNNNQSGLLSCFAFYK